MSEEHYIQDEKGERIFRPIGYGVPKQGDWFVPLKQTRIVAVQFDDARKHTTHGSPRVLLQEIPGYLQTQYVVCGSDGSKLETAIYSHALGETKRLLDAGKSLEVKVKSALAPQPDHRHNGGGVLVDAEDLRSILEIQLLSPQGEKIRNYDPLHRLAAAVQLKVD